MAHRCLGSQDNHTASRELIGGASGCAARRPAELCVLPSSIILDLAVLPTIRRYSYDGEFRLIIGMLSTGRSEGVRCAPLRVSLQSGAELARVSRSERHARMLIRSEHRFLLKRALVLRADLIDQRAADLAQRI